MRTLRSFVNDRASESLEARLCTRDLRRPCLMRWPSVQPVERRVIDAPPQQACVSRKRQHGSGPRHELGAGHTRVANWQDCRRHPAARGADADIVCSTRHARHEQISEQLAQEHGSTR